MYLKILIYKYIIYNIYNGILQCPHGNVSVVSGTIYRLSSYGLRAIFFSQMVYTRDVPDNRIPDNEAFIVTG